MLFYQYKELKVRLRPEIQLRRISDVFSFESVEQVFQRPVAFAPVA